jgi:myo-inositol-1(or 4)-monophosphatase
LRVSQRKGLEGALIGTGFPFRPAQHSYLDSYLSGFKAVALQTAGIRRAGAASLDLAFVAAGRLDGFFELGLAPWDMAAGDLLIREAGGFVCDMAGGHNYLKSGNIIAGNIKVMKALVTTVAPHLPEDMRR